MEIESLQIKRVVANWDTHKNNYIPKNGEYVLIDVEGSPRVVVLGDGKTTLGGLVASSSNVMPSKGDVIGVVTNSIESLNPTTSDTTTNVETVYPSNGVSKKFARSDHKHGITRQTIESILGTNMDVEGNFNCRKIKIGTGTPNGGSVGDIYIKYKEV